MVESRRTRIIGDSMIRMGTVSPAISRAAIQRFSALCGIAAPLLSTTVLLAVSHLHPGYSLTRQRISELGTSGAPYATLLNMAGLEGSGVLLVLLSLGLYLEFKNQRTARIGSGFIALAGIALVMAGIFPCDVGYVGTSASGIAHGLFARIGELSIMCAALAMWLGLNGHTGWDGQSWASLTVAVVAVTLYVPYQFHSFAPWKGAIQRMLVMVVLIWIEIMSINLLTRSRADAPDPSS